MAARRMPDPRSAAHGIGYSCADGHGRPIGNVASKPGILEIDLNIPHRKTESLGPGPSFSGATPAVEDLIEESRLVGRCLVHQVGDGDRVALVAIDDAEAANMCREQIEGSVEQAVSRANSLASSGEKIERFVIVNYGS
jgi:hypothetical protein